mgnify:CR=1 FL=1
MAFYQKGKTLRTITFLTLITVTYLFIACSSESMENNQPIEPKALVKNYMDAIGGDIAIKQFHTRIISGQWTDDRPYRGDPVKVPFTVWANDNGYWRFTSTLESYGYDDQGGWRLDSTGLTHDPFQERSKLGFVFDPTSILNLDRYFLNRHLGEQMSLNYRQVTGVRTDRDSTYYTLWFDNETHLLNHIGYHWNLKNYKKVDGVKIPHLIEAGRKGGAILFQMDTIHHNIPIPDSILFRQKKLIYDL